MKAGAHPQPNRAIELGFRGAAFAVIAVFGYFSVASTFAESIAAVDPDRGHALAPWDGRIAALMALNMSGVDAKADDRERADMLARDALLKDATAVTAVSTLALNAEVRGDPSSAQRYFRYANGLSRRDLPTQLWMIEDAVARNDVPGALRHYDIALRTSDQTHDILFPILASAMSDETVRKALVQTLAGRPVWAGEFIDYAASKAPDPRAVASLFEGLAIARVAPLWGAQATVVNRLVSSGAVSEAWAYYATVKSKSDPRFSRDPGFAEDGLTPSAFDWAPITNNLIQTSIQPNGKDGLVDFAVSAGNSGVVLQQSEVFPRGQYSIEGQSRGIDQPDNSRPVWRVRCSDGRELVRVALPSSGQNVASFSARFTVPDRCEAQMLELVAMPSNSTAGVTGQILKFLVRPVAR